LYTVVNGTHVNFGTTRCRKQLYITLQCCRGFQKLELVVVSASSKPFASGVHLFLVVICIVKNNIKQNRTNEIKINLVTNV
jgi:hypothetical protein